jgi:SOS-response transcriptional repressor LexA
MVNPVQDARDSDIIAARLGEEATIKTLTHRNGSIVLEAANPADRDITVQPGMDFGVLGVVCGVFRPGFDANMGGNGPQS